MTVKVFAVQPKGQVFKGSREITSKSAETCSAQMLPSDEYTHLPLALERAEKNCKGVKYIFQKDIRS
ncbi:hypothetical protein Y1Q_0017900 [Alligator mississippiensis]|uniref:Uncharacterized protein n=1 Tax=Alligator mississippiensis TaxID=8496 RepID=A0A151MXR0_ALLMI|nr:hypothetical protein Y1Q_0017900 [Alligator mississippiensis]